MHKITQDSFYPKEGEICVQKSLNMPMPEESVNEKYGNLPPHFIANQGQIDSDIQYYAQGQGFRYTFTPACALFTFYEVLADTEEPISRTQSIDLLSKKGAEKKQRVWLIVKPFNGFPLLFNIILNSVLWYRVKAFFVLIFYYKKHFFI